MGRVESSRVNSRHWLSIPTQVREEEENEKEEEEKRKIKKIGTWEQN